MTHSRFRSLLRRSSAWVKFRRLHREGFVKAYRRWSLWAKILDTPPVYTDPVAPATPVEVHLLCYGGDYLCAIWALKSFYRFAEVRYPLVLHVQGKVTARVPSRLRAHFPNARIIMQPSADREVERWLNEHGLLRLLTARRSSPFMMKLTDFPLLSESIHLLTLDTDLIFFRRPTELLGASLEPSLVSLFQRDVSSTYNISGERALSDLGVKLAPRVNTGIMLFPRESLDLTRCEDYLAHPDVARPSGWIEQTLYALCASEQGRVTFLPDSYLVSLEEADGLDDLVVRHYAGPSRPLLTSEGMPRLIGSGFLRYSSV